MRFPNQRLAQLFSILRNETVPQTELARRMGVSTRTVRADIAALKSLLALQGAEIQLSRGSGYSLNLEQVADAKCFEEPVPQAKIPRTVAARVRNLLYLFLTSAYSLKLEEIAQSWFVSRATLQNDMLEVRERLQRYSLHLETRPCYGMKLFGNESSIRTCLTDLLCEIRQENLYPQGLQHYIPDEEIVGRLQPVLQASFLAHQLKLSDESEQYLLTYCGVAVQRLREGFPIWEVIEHSGEEYLTKVVKCLEPLLSELAGKALPLAEICWLKINIAARCHRQPNASEINADDADALVDYLLDYIALHYNYPLQNDAQLRADMITHIKTMITRLRYQIHIPNPLLDNIKQHYPMAYDVTLAAVNSWVKYSPYTISENEIGFLVLHIGVGLERHYQVEYQRQPRVLIVCDTGTSTLRMIETLLLRQYPQLQITRSLTQREYELLDRVEEDFVVSTVKVEEKERPVVLISLFPAAYQWAQIDKLAQMDRTRLSVLQRFFDAQHFQVIEEQIDQDALFARVCRQLQHEGYVDQNFLASVKEREAIVSTMLGGGIAIPHALGLQAKKTIVHAVLLPEGIRWGDDIAYAVFLLAISKEDYEDAMAIYELLVSLMREGVGGWLRECTDFSTFCLQVGSH